MRAQRKGSAVLWLLTVILVLAVPTAGAQDATVQYLEGDPQLRSAGGATSYLDFGSRLRAGDSVVTGRRDFVELRQGDASSLRVNANTVFTIREIERDGQREQVLSTSVGSVGMRFNRLAGREPLIGTNTAVAGVRGTELTVYAGADGSTLFLVESGLVEVTAAGQSVELSANEGVEVPAGGPPGQKFQMIGRELSFQAWAQEKQDLLLQDPLGALNNIQTMIRELQTGLEEWVDAYKRAKEVSDAARREMDAITDQAAREKFRDERWSPLALQTGTAVLNYRYYALSALSLRQHVLAPMYVQMRSRNMLAKAPDYGAFLERYSVVLATFRTAFEPYIEINDF